MENTTKHVPLQERRNSRVLNKRVLSRVMTDVDVLMGQDEMPNQNVSAHGSETAVWGAVIGNFTVALLKMVAYFMSGSGSMLSEAIHSFADTMNQCLLIVGMKRSKVDDDGSPVGHYRETYVWALISAVGIFFLGAGVTIHHGITTLFHPVELEDVRLAILVLILSFLIEGYTLLIAVRAVHHQSKLARVSFFKYMATGSDPTAVAVVLEDSVAVLGVSIAMVSILVAESTGDAVFDSVGSILIGALLGFVAVFLIRRNASLLTGVAPGTQQLATFKAILQKHPAVHKVVDLRGEMIGSGVCRLKADIEFNGQAIGKQYLQSLDIDNIHAMVSRSPAALERYLLDFSENIIRRLADVVDDIEEDIQKMVPGSVYIDLEADRRKAVAKP